MIRFGILAGVSSDPQARDDKASIDDQIDTCRRAIEYLGGMETDGPFVLDGYSRTGYVNLSDALADIPPLADAVKGITEDRYDVLIMDNIERMGDLAPMLSTIFKKHRKQLYSARQSGRLHDPYLYDPNTDESGDILIHVEGIIQKYRINKLQRGLLLGIKKRVEEGNYSTRWPYGYKREEKTLVLDPPVATLLIQLKDEFLRGAPLSELVKIAQSSGICSRGGPRWHRFTIRRALCNPFYAGKVFSRRWKVVSYKKRTANGKRSATMKLNPGATLHPGKHPPLWTWEEHLRIVQEMEERYKQQPRHDIHNFSGLMVCTVCGKRVNFRGRKYRCRTAPDHIALKEADANRLIARSLADALQNYQEEPIPPRSTDTTQDSIEVLAKRIAKIHREFEEDTGMYTASEAREKIAALRGQIQKIESRREDLQHQEATLRRRAAKRAEMMPKLRLLPHLFAQQDSVTNNHMLRDILTAIYVTPEHTFTFDFR